MPAPSVSMLRFVPDLARSVGFLPVASLPKRGLSHPPIDGLPLPLDTLHLVVFGEPRPPQLLEEPGALPFLETVVHGGTCPQLPGQGVPLDTRAQHVDDGSEGFAVVHARPATLGVGGSGRDQGLDLLPELVAHRPGLGACHTCYSLLLHSAATTRAYTTGFRIRSKPRFAATPI